MSTLKQVIFDYLEAETKECKATLWGKEYIIKPYLCKKIIGDGLQVVYLSTLNQRPAYWLIRIDSRIDIGDDGFPFCDSLNEMLIQIIEDECGYCREDSDCYDTEDELMADNFHFPQIYTSGGHHWGLMRNFAPQMKIN